MNVPLSNSLGSVVDVNIFVVMLYTTVAVPYLITPCSPLKLLAHVHKHVDSAIQVPSNTKVFAHDWLNTKFVHDITHAQ